MAETSGREVVHSEGGIAGETSGDWEGHVKLMYECRYPQRNRYVGKEVLPVSSNVEDWVCV